MNLSISIDEIFVKNEFKKMSLKENTVEFFKDEGGTKNHLLVNFFTNKKIKFLICYVNDGYISDKILPEYSSNGLIKDKLNYKLYDIIDLKNKTGNKKLIKMKKNIIEFTPQKPAEYQMSFSILKASRNMDNALFFVKMLDSSNNLIDTTSRKICVKSKRKIQASLRTPSDIK